MAGRAPELLRSASVAAFLLACLWGMVLLVLGRRGAALLLTGSTLLSIISTLWLEQLMLRVLQPGRPRFRVGEVFSLLGRLCFWGVVGVLLYLFRQELELWAVAAGVGCFLGGLLWAGGRTSPSAGS